MNAIATIYKELAALIGCEDSEYVPRILAKMCDPDQAKILLAFPVKSTSDLAEKLNLDQETADKQIQELFEKGLVIPQRKGGFRAFKAVTELKDTTPANPKFDKEYGEEFFDLWDAYLDSDEIRQWWLKQPKDPEGKHRFMRIIPKWKSIKDVPGVLPCDDMRLLLTESKDTLGLNICSCQRISQKHVPKDIPHELCLVNIRTAEYCINRGTGRKITLKEAMDFLEQTEKYPLVHITWNEKPMDMLIGSCGSYCCVFRWSPPGTIDECAPSRFEATVNLEMCLGEKCKKCAELCLFGAAKMKYYSEFSEERAHIETERCMGCGNCVIQCPIGALTMKLVRPPEFIPDSHVGSYY